MATNTLAHVRDICLALPEAQEKEASALVRNAYLKTAPKRLRALLDAS